MQYFEMFFSKSVLQTLVKHTNAYGAMRQEGKKKPWENISIKDLKSFIALVIYMGLLKCFKLTDYWRKSQIYNLPYPSQIMSSRKFMNISKALHLSDPKVDAENDKKEHLNTTACVGSNRCTRTLGTPAEPLSIPLRTSPLMNEWWRRRLEMDSNSTWRTNLQNGGTNFLYWQILSVAIHGTSSFMKERQIWRIAKVLAMILSWFWQTKGCWEAATSCLLTTFTPVPSSSETCSVKRSGLVAPFVQTALATRRHRLLVAIFAGLEKMICCLLSGRTRGMCWCAPAFIKPIMGTPLRGMWKEPMEFGPSRISPFQPQCWTTTS